MVVLAMEAEGFGSLHNASYIKIDDNKATLFFYLQMKLFREVLIV